MLHRHSTQGVDRVIRLLSVLGWVATMLVLVIPPALLVLGETQPWLYILLAAAMGFLGAAVVLWGAAAAYDHIVQWLDDRYNPWKPHA